MELNNILIDLEIIKQIKENDKLGVIITPGTKKLFVDINSKISPLLRWYYGYNRENTIEYLEQLIIKIDNISNFLIEGKHYNTSHTLADTISSGKNGLELLKTTYQDDSVTVAKLIILINKLESIILSLKKVEVNNNNNNIY